MAAAIRSPVTVNLTSSSPATSSTGISSSASRPHNGSWAATPSVRRAAASPSAGFARRLSRSSSVGSRVENIRWPSHRRRNAAVPTFSMSSASCSSAWRRAARSSDVDSPGDPPTNTRARTSSGRSSASFRHSRPPIE